jgi:hypothetical protein
VKRPVSGARTGHDTGLRGGNGGRGKARSHLEAVSAECVVAVRRTASEDRSARQGEDNEIAEGSD